MTYNVFGATLNHAQSIKLLPMVRTAGQTQTYTDGYAAAQALG